MFTVDKQVELAVSQGVPTYMGTPRIKYDVPSRPCGCGAKAGNFHNLGCKWETCPICLESGDRCGCNHD